MIDFKNRKRKSIRALKYKSSQGDLEAMFQLAENFKDGQFVDQNSDLSEEYYRKAITLFQEHSLQISSMKLVNFRAFESIKVDFCNNYQHHSNLTVFVGNNGSGKTTILDAISKNMSWLKQRIVSQGGNGKLIDERDINNSHSAEYASIGARFLILKNMQYRAELSKSKDASNTSRKNSVHSFTQLANIYRLVNERDKSFGFPIMAFYSVERSLEINKKDIITFDEMVTGNNWNKFDGYKKSLNGTADFRLFFRWFKHAEDIKNSTNRTTENILDKVKDIRTELLDKLSKRKKTSEEDINSILDSFEQEIQDEATLLDNTGSKGGRKQYGKLVDHVTDAIYRFMPEFENLRIQRDPTLDMLFDKNGVTLSVLQLSQGEKSLLALIADIARRLVLLNPALDQPLNGNGIVLIDEIDLHLHPKWQQSILPKLLETFPKIQFIVTTHSPQVLSSIPSESIQIIEDSAVFAAPLGSKGAKSSRLLKRIFGVDVRPPEDSNTLKLKEYKDLVYQDRWEGTEAKKLRKELDSQFGDEEPDLTELDLYIENREWEISIEKDQ